MKQVPAEYYQLMEQLQAVDFVLVELTLYLDTHNDDQEAIHQFNHYAKERKRIKSYLKVSLDLYNNMVTATQAILGTGMILLGHGRFK